MRYLAVDLGQKRVGLAACDARESIVSPLRVLSNSASLCNQIAQVVAEEDIEAVIVGLPLNMDGTEGPPAKAAREFSQQLKDKSEVPVFLQDERLSSFAAESKMVGMELTRKKKRGRVDAIAAAEILQAFLDAKQQ